MSKTQECGSVAISLMTQWRPSRSKFVNRWRNAPFSGYSFVPLRVEKTFAVGNEKLEIARLRLTGVRIIAFVDDAMRNREPKPAACVVRCSNPFLRAVRPARLRAGSAKALAYGAPPFSIAWALRTSRPARRLA